MGHLPDSTFFEVERHGAVAEIRMNRPEKANGMTPDFWADLPRLVEALDADNTVRALVLTGAGRNFTGGMDLSTFSNLAEMTESEPARVAYALRRKILRLKPQLWWKGGVDIIITHAPPRHVHDGPDRCHWGFNSFNWLIQKYSPKYFIHGHIHAVDCQYVLSGFK